MLLCDITVNDTLYRVSNEYIPIRDGLYNACISSFSNISIESDSIYGGYCISKHSNIEFIPSLFGDIWPPPKDIHIKIFYFQTIERSMFYDIGDDDEFKMLIYDGMAKLTDITDESIRYTLYSDGREKIYTQVLFSDTLIQIFSDICGQLNLSLNSHYAADIGVKYSFDGNKTGMEILNDLALYYNHIFWIQNDELTLMDMNEYNNEIFIDEFDYFRCEYNLPRAVSLLKTKPKNTDEIKYNNSIYPYGDEIEINPCCDDDGDHGDTYLSKIADCYNGTYITLYMPISSFEYKDQNNNTRYVFPFMGDKIHVKDKSKYKDIDIAFIINGINLNFDNNQLILKGKTTTDIS